MEDLKNRRVTVMGLGRFGGGIAVARWLAHQGAHVLVTDKDSADSLADSIKQLAGLPIEFRLGEHRHDDFQNTSLVVASPAVPLTNTYLQTARKSGVPITTEIRLFLQRCPAKRTLGVTGTKGKSTTTAMLGAMLGAMLAQKYRTHIGGNIGKSLLDTLPQIAADDLVLLELSSYMLEHLRAMRWSPHVALITMLAQDHLEWHGSLEAYIAAKAVLLEFQKPTDFAILNQTDSASKNLAAKTPAAIKWFGPATCPDFALRIPGIHNQINAKGAFAAASCLGITWDDAQTALSDFQSLPHRLELVHEERGVKFYNDSIATIPQAAIAALESFPSRKVIQIVGGHLKDLSIKEMCQALASRAKAAICIGEKGPEIAAEIRRIAAPAALIVHQCPDLPRALPVAKGIAQPGDIVLLSTGCKSYDQFTNFEERGQTFARLARQSS
jgi:UDP-N-acetylmuramoylalanine--D-glutamate ligase